MSKDLEQRVGRLEAQVDMLIRMASGGNTATSVSQDSNQWIERLSRKQHAVMLMLSGGASNGEIASRLGCTESTVKGHIRGAQDHIIRGTGVTVRNRLMTSRMYTEAMGSYTDVEFERFCGLKPTWSTSWSAEDRAINKDLYST